MPRNSAEYMREYRKRRKEKGLPVSGTPRQPRADYHALAAENARLTEEVARLKRELAKRTDTTPLTKLATIYDDGQGGQLRKREPGITPERLDPISPEARRARQAVIDAALAKVNRTARK